MITKIAGTASFVIGLLIVIGFPWVSQYQEARLARAGILLGLLLIAVGLFLMKI